MRVLTQPDDLKIEFIPFPGSDVEHVFPKRVRVGGAGGLPLVAVESGQKQLPGHAAPPALARKLQPEVQRARRILSERAGNYSTTGDLFIFILRTF
jgi:hypothetical protein